MIKTISAIIAATTLIATQSNAQDLRKLIPHNANIVGSINPKVVDDNIKEQTYRSQFMSTLFLDYITHTGTKDSNYTLADLGINTQEKSYLYHTSSDSINYFVQLYPLSSKEKLHNILAKEHANNITQHNNYTVYKKYNGALYCYDNEKLIIIEPSINKDYFEKDTNNVYGIKPVRYYDYFTDSPIQAQLDSSDVAEAYESVEEATTTEDYAVEHVYNHEADDETNDEATETHQVYTDYQPDDTYRDSYEHQRKLVDSIEHMFTLNYLDQMTRIEETILSNKHYIKSEKKDAYANLFIKHLDKIFPNSISMYNFGGINYSRMMPEYYTINLHSNKNSLDLNYEVKLDKQIAKQYKKVEKRRVSKKLLKYVNSETNVAALSYAFNTEQYLQMGYQQLQSNYFTHLFNDEAKLIADITELLLDEKAIGKAVKGDGLFLISGVSKYKTTYTTYEYEEENNFEYKETKTTKVEPLPDLLYMYSTENPLIHRKVLNYITKWNYILSEDGIYSMNDKYSYDIPYKLHILVKDDIIFLGTNIDEIKKIAFNQYKGKASCKVKRQMRKNSMYGYFDPSKLVNKIITDDVNLNIKTNNMLNSLGLIEWKNPRMKCKTAKGSIKAYSKDGAQNGIQYLNNTIENIFHNLK